MALISFGWKKNYGNLVSYRDHFLFLNIIRKDDGDYGGQQSFIHACRINKNNWENIAWARIWLISMLLMLLLLRIFEMRFIAITVWMWISWPLFVNNCVTESVNISFISFFLFLLIYTWSTHRYARIAMRYILIFIFSLNARCYFRSILFIYFFFNYFNLICVTWFYFCFVFCTNWN